MTATPDDTADLIKVGKAAELLGVSVATVYRYLSPDRQVLTPVRVHPRLRVGQPVLRVLLAEVQALVATGERVAS